jgi:hypothetical protein
VNHSDMYTSWRAQVLSEAAHPQLFQDTHRVLAARECQAHCTSHEATTMLLHLLGHITSSAQGNNTWDVLDHRAVGAA